MNMGNMQVVLGLLVFALMAGHSSATFCVCKPGLSTSAYQKAIDYACGAPGVDCSPIRPNGQCYNPDTIQAHCSYAANYYFQKNAGKGATCDFQGTATPTNSDPSGGGCSFSAGSGSTSPGTTSPVTTPTTSPSTGTTTPVTPVSGGGGTGTTPVSGGGGTGMTPVTPVSGSGSPTYGTGTGTSTPGSGTGTGTGTGTTSPYGAGNPTSTGVYGAGGIGSGMAPTGSSMDDSYGTRLERLSMASVLALLISAIMWM